MRRTKLLPLVLLALVSACLDSGGLVNVPQDPDDIFWSLELDQHAINLSLDQSQPEYYTYQLDPTARRLDGTPFPLTSDVRPEFVSTDTIRVRVSGTGLITAKELVPPSNPVLIIATMSAGAGPITNADTAYVVVTPDVRPVESFSIDLSHTEFGVGYDTIIDAQAIGPDGEPVTGIRVAHESSLPKVASYDITGLFKPMTMGEVTLRASTMAYGTAHSDSVKITVTEPVVFQVLNNGMVTSEGDVVLSFEPAVLTIEAGQGVAWAPGNFGCVYGVEFEDPTNVGPSPVDGQSGNLTFFCGFGNRVIRMFDVPGTYDYQAGSLFGFQTAGSPKIIVEPSS